jgi:hypothetical protein
MPHIVDLVIDVSNAGNLPEDALFRLRNSYSSTIPKLGTYIFVGATDKFKRQFEEADRYYTALGGSLDYCFLELIDSEATV